MLSTLIISLREYLEVFLIIGVFLGITKKLNLKKTKEILFASLIGIIISLLLPIITFIFSDKASIFLTEKNAELLEGYLMIFSGFFLGYVILSLHNFINRHRSKNILVTHEKIKNNIFDLSLFLTIIFFVVREGFEIALFTSTTSLFSKFIENIIGLLLGFIISSLLGLLVYIGYLKFSISKIYKLTEYLIIILGGSFIANGISELLEIYFRINIKNILPIKILFLPEKETFIGHFLKSSFALQKDYSLIFLLIIISYIFIINWFFKTKKDKIKS